MSSVYGLGAYSPYMQYTWQSASSSSSSLANAQTSATSMSGSGMAGQISSMVALTRYAMEKMGISEDGNVTFSQISKYRNELSQSFDTALRAAMSSVGIQNMSGLTFTISATGDISVRSDNPSDRQAAQSYIDAHPELGRNLIKGISDEGVTLTSAISFRLSGSGFVVLAPEAEDLTVALEKKAGLADTLREELTALGVPMDGGLRLTFNEDGKLVVDGETENADAANAWLAEQDELTEELKKLVADAGTALDGLALILPASGSMTAEATPRNTEELRNSLENALAATDLGRSLRDGLKAEGLLGSTGSVHLTFDANGTLTVDGEMENADAINAWLAGQDEMAKTLRDACEKAGVKETTASFALNAAGDVAVSLSEQPASDREQLNAARKAFAKMGKEASALREGLAALSIDLNAEFTIKINDDGSVTIGGTHPDIAKIQKVFDSNAGLVKTYSQIEALSGLDQARAAMNISPSAMRKSLQMESLAVAWWSGGMSNSYFGTYSGQNGFNMLSGLNISV